MDIHNDWNRIKRIFNDGAKSNFYFSVASTNTDGSPHVTPIGSLMLYEPGRGVYLDELPVRLSRNIGHNPRVCVMAVNGGTGFWFSSLIRGRFNRHVGLRLTGTAGGRRPGTQAEIDRWLRRVSLFRWTKGYDRLWRGMKMVRDITFDGVMPVTGGRMSAGLN